MTITTAVPTPLLCFSLDDRHLEPWSGSQASQAASACCIPTGKTSLELDRGPTEL